jgi:hypothetical protein
MSRTLIIRHRLLVSIDVVVRTVSKLTGFLGPMKVTIFTRDTFPCKLVTFPVTGADLWFVSPKAKVARTWTLCELTRWAVKVDVARAFLLLACPRSEDAPTLILTGAELFEEGPLLALDRGDSFIKGP